MAELNPPEGLRLSENAAEDWKRFKHLMELYFAAAETKEPRTQYQKAATFLHIAGQEAIDVFNTFKLTEEKKDYDVLVNHFEEYCLPGVNETYKRYIFRIRVQEPREGFETFFLDLKTKANTCNFGDLSDSMLRDQIVYGTSTRKLRKRLLGEEDLNLVKPFDFCKSADISQSQNKAFEQLEQNVEPVASNEKRQAGRECKHSSFVHEPRRCQAYGKICK